MKTLQRMTGIAVLAMLVTAGCESGPQTVERQAPTLDLAANQNEVLVGESTTVFAQTTNMLGREVEIEWGSTLGEVEPLRDGRMAQFRSDTPGTSIVTAEVNVDGEILRDHINIVVNPVE
ncbi:MAG: hypothetical protein WD009_10645 [Phycisphaeraceae bacterium]